MVQEHKRISGLSGNEIYFLERMGYRPGQLCVGNSVVALGVARGIGAGLSTLGGGEIEEVTRLVHDGRARAFDRMMEEAGNYGGVGLTGVSFDVINHGGNLEFITTGSTIRSATAGTAPEKPRFSTSADVAKLFCQADAGFTPIRFVFGNVAYSIGLGGTIAGGFKSLARGEVAEYTQIFDRTRHLALTRLTDEAKRCNANAVVGIETTISPLLGAQEMIMVGTASHHPAIEAFDLKPVTSDMTNEEMWNMVNVGFLPIRLVMGVSVYSLGLKGGIFSAVQTLGGGEVAGLTEILYEAREKALARIEADAERCGADEVIGVKTRIYDLGGGLDRVHGDRHRRQEGGGHPHQVRNPAGAGDPAGSRNVRRRVRHAQPDDHHDALELGLGAPAAERPAGPVHRAGGDRLLHRAARAQALSAPGARRARIRGLLWVLVAAGLGAGLVTGLPVLARQMPWPAERWLADRLGAGVAGRTCAGGAPARAALATLVGRIYPLYPDDAALPLTIDVIAGTTVNAYATLGGHVHVFDGLLQQARSPEELAGVLAHEIEHVRQRHIIQGVAVNVLGAGALALLVPGGHESATRLAAALMELKFSRGEEAEADEKGLQRLQRAQVDATALMQFFLRARDLPQAPELVSNHPDNGARAALAQRFRDYPVRPILDAQQWQALRGICR